MSSNKRNQLKLKQKYEIIVKSKSGVKPKQLMIEYNLKTRSHVSNILTNELNITQRYESLAKKQQKTTSRVRSSNYPEVEKVLIIEY